MKCLNCKNELVKWQKKFCSKSCAATYNNKKYPKRVRNPKNTCIDCGSYPVWREGARCSTCRSKHAKHLRETRTVSYYENWNGRPYDDIRKQARTLMNELGVEKKCAICGYDFYVELCHIKSISSFDPQTVISVVNDPSNLIYLCPNHHKELDKEHLRL